MECPKCSYKIDDSTTVCPNCKKVLKLVCPICKTLNKTNTCHKCGYIIVNKCHECGKINQTIHGKCTKCGFSTYVSAILQGSNIDEFASITVDFPNLDLMPKIFGSNKLFLKFKEKLDTLIYNYATSIGLKRHILDNTYIIRFNKDYTFTSSAKNAVKSAVELLNLVAKLNYKLTKAKDTQLKCNIAILKRSAYAQNEDYKSGINIQLLYENIKSKQIIKSLQLVVDSSIYQSVSNDFKMNSLGLTLAKNQATMLYEVNLTKLIEPETDDVELDEFTGEIKIPEILDSQMEELENEDSIYDMDGINFDEIHCTFTKSFSKGLSTEIATKLLSKNKNIVAVKATYSNMPRTLELIDKISENKIYSDIYRVTCYDGMKYKPYGFFYELISAIYGFAVTEKTLKNNNFQGFNRIDTSNFVRDLINLNTREFPHPEDVRYGLFEIFESIFKSMKRTLIYVENFEKIDDTSYELLQMMFKKFDEYDVSYLIMADKDFSLHKSSHFLLSKQEYSEITVKSTPVKNLIEANQKLYKNILDSFYLQKIAKNTKGSPMYFMQSTIHLMEMGIFEVENGSIEIKNPITVMLPTTLNELIQRKLLFLQSSSPKTFKLLISLLLLGPRIDIPSLQQFEQSDLSQHIEVLDGKGYLYLHANSIYFQNYNLYYDNAFKILDRKDKQEIATFLLHYLFTQNKAHPTKALLYYILENSKNEFIEWENLSALNMSLGDFSGYLNCSIKFLKLLDNNIDENSQKSLDDYKMEVYENIANLLYKYTPGKIYSITQVILDNLEKNTQDKKVINLCNKMMQGCLLTGNYTHALQLSHKILSRMENADINPKNANFGISAFLISLVKIEILFNIGDLENCITLGEEIFEILSKNDINALKPKTITDQQFTDLLTDASGFIAFAEILQLKTDIKPFLDKACTVIGKLPMSYALFDQLIKLIHGEKINIDSDMDNNNGEKFAKFLSNILSAFSIRGTDQKLFTEKIYNAKLGAKVENLHQFELFSDLLIGRSYFKLGNIRKATTIYNSVLETAVNNGLINIKYITWYVLAELNLSQNELEIANGIINNAIVELEKKVNSNMYILMLFKFLLAKTLKMKHEDIQADFCYNQAIGIAKNNNIKI